MDELFAAVARINRLAGLLTGLDYASDSGRLSPEEETEYEALKVEQRELDARAEAIWRELPRAAPEQLFAYDATVDGISNGTLTHDNAALATSIRERVPATRSPTRTYDAWAIWITLDLARRRGA